MPGPVLVLLCAFIDVSRKANSWRLRTSAAALTGSAGAVMARGGVMPWA
ncbi:hypothetical protein [Streptomyces anulatus]